MYYENLFIDKTIILQGENKNTTIIDGAGNNHAIILYNVNNVKISGFTIQNSGGGILSGLVILYASNNEVFNNIFKNNYFGINLKNVSSENIIYHNIFIDNTYNAIDYTTCNNQWDYGYPTGGNFWDDHTGDDYYNGPFQNITGSDGIIDEHYILQGPDNCQDRYPLVDLSFNPNNPPNTPIYLNPSINLATNIPINTILSWTCTDPDDDPLTYDVYFGITPNPPKVSNKQTSTTYNPGTMNYSTVYYWKIVAWDNHASYKNGPIWTFTTISEANNPPNTPNNPNPNNQATNIPINTILSWTCTDPDGDPLTYDVYFGTTNPPLIISNNQTSTTYNPGTMNYNSKYYWKIVAWDDKDAKSIGPIWEFNIKVNNPPYPPRNPNPGNHNISVDINADLSWLGDDPDSGDTVTYDIYFGTTNPPIKKSSNQTTTTYEPGTMNYNTKYYWKIIAWDNKGAKTVGSIWDFTTGIEPNNPPNLPSDPNPANNVIGININVIISWSCTDPDDDTLNYDIYFGPNNNPPLIKSNHDSTSYTPDDITNNTKYYWKIVAKDNHAAATTGPIWSFTTIYVNYPPITPYNPTPQNGKTSININQNLYWDSGDLNTNDTVTYDIYFDINNPPVTKISDQLANTYDPGTMNYDTKYYWKIIAWDNHGESSTGPIWSFTTGAQTSGGGDSNGGGGDIIPPNKSPIADASASESKGFVNTKINFDGSYSTDEDGEITKYTWDFGDNNVGYGIKTTHIYKKTGTYTVKLTVTDNNDVSDTYTFKVTISQPNKIPTIPQIDGPKTGKQNIEYSFSAKSTDPDNDNIQYVFNWGDDQTNETDFVTQGITQIIKHKWTHPGIYKINIYAIDSKYAVSTTAETYILIDVIYCKNLGYLIDEDSDGIYDSFYSNQTGIKTNTEKQQDEIYLINSDTDSDWDYKYNTQTDTLTSYSSKTTPDKISIDNTMLFYIVIIIIILVILSIIVAALRKKGKKKNKTDNEEEKKTRNKNK